ncbi:hypothetical protein ACHAWO_011547 [Cyclotella atomus]|uniref:Prolyl 4-hydroxylase alpha subunit domain-containing protein n=1 Tax=Cyclotella atomus TaxID=382360 RepID=A0ABD3N3H8_9STRA
MKVKCIDLALAHDGTNNDDKSIDCMHQFAWVIDNALSKEFLAAVNDFRQSLPLDDKRPTVKRRFFSSAKQCPDILDELKGALLSALSLSTTQHGGASANVMLDQYHPQSNHPTNDNDSLEFTIDHQKQLQVHILSYMRFLEYNNVGGNLDAHTDGNKICESTGRQSTHTMLLYLSNCEVGGETRLLYKEPTSVTQQTAKYVTIEAVKPVIGRILLFPHATLHEGAPTVDVPKICLRAEVAVYVH